MGKPSTYIKYRLESMADYVMQLVFNSLDANPSRISIEVKKSTVVVKDDGSGFNIENLMTLCREPVPKPIRSERPPGPRYGSGGQFMICLAKSCREIIIDLSRQKLRLTIDPAGSNTITPIEGDDAISIGSTVTVVGLFETDFSYSTGKYFADKLELMVERIKLTAVLHPMVEFVVDYDRSARRNPKILRIPRAGHSLGTISHIWSIGSYEFGAFEPLRNSHFHAYFASKSNFEPTTGNNPFPIIFVARHQIQPSSQLAQDLRKIYESARAPFSNKPLKLVYLTIRPPSISLSLYQRSDQYYEVRCAKTDTILKRFEEFTKPLRDDGCSEMWKHVFNPMPKLIGFLESESIIAELLPSQVQPDQPIEADQKLRSRKLSQSNQSDDDKDIVPLKKWKTKNSHQIEHQPIMLPDEHTEDLPPNCRFKREPRVLNIDLERLMDQFGSNAMNKTQFLSSRISNFQPIGQVDNKFIACVSKEKDGKSLVVLMDQHACHERIRLERLKQSFEDPSTLTGGMVTLESPIELGADCTHFKKKDFELYEEIGLKITLKSSGNYEDGFLLVAISNQLLQLSLKSFRPKKSFLLNVAKDAASTISRVQGNIKLSDLDEIQRHMEHTACRGAIKFGDKISFETAKQIIADLSNCIQPEICAHGRPTFEVVSVIKNPDSHKP